MRCSRSYCLQSSVSGPRRALRRTTNERTGLEAAVALQPGNVQGCRCRSIRSGAAIAMGMRRCACSKEMAAMRMGDNTSGRRKSPSRVQQLKPLRRPPPRCVHTCATMPTSLRKTHAHASHIENTAIRAACGHAAGLRIQVVVWRVALQEVPVRRVRVAILRHPTCPREEVRVALHVQQRHCADNGAKQVGPLLATSTTRQDPQIAEHRKPTHTQETRSFTSSGDSGRLWSTPDVAKSGPDQHRPHSAGTDRTWADFRQSWANSDRMGPIQTESTQCVAQTTEK